MAAPLLRKGIPLLRLRLQRYTCSWNPTVSSSSLVRCCRVDWARRGGVLRGEEQCGA
ncbi:hypothetical protein Gohar_008683 [Gossypium harknessii]|uniref:Uncharacterized protein n=1 Tax=Gossypium harknessii TaxID=34285 RepID=A0A7J9GKG4_9ROSI|nr:hypothetical protein [Gossypium harknessii]